MEGTSKNRNEEITDDCMLLEIEGYKVKLIEGEETNRKITTQKDIEILEKYLKK